MAWLERNQLLVLAAAVLLLLVGLLVRDIGRSDPPALVLGESDSSGPLQVHVAGAVKAPGVYELTAGDRVHDALAAAGGSTEGADLDALNLARRLRDGERVTVPLSEVAGVAAVATLSPGQKLDINTATAEQLDQLPGIGEAYSRGIVDSRIVDGPYTAVDDLVSRRVLPQATLDQIRDRLVVETP